MKKYSLFLALLVALAACQNNPTEGEQSQEQSEENTVNSEELKREVMDLHDVVMPQMTPMSKLQGQLKLAAQESADSSQLLAAADELKEAKEAMMQWMRNFSSDYSDELSEEEKVAMLRGEKAKMEAIKAQTEAALKNGRALLPAEGQEEN